MEIFQRPNLTESIYADTTPWDLATISVGIVNFVALFILYVYILFHHDYQPFKAKQLWVVGLSLLFAFCFWFSFAVNLIVIPRLNFFNRSCSVWGIWGLTVFGLYSFMSGMIFRFYRVYRIIVEAREFWKYPFLVMLVIAFPGFLMGVIGEAGKLYYFDDSPMYMACFLNYWYQIAQFALTAIYLGVCIFFVVRLRSIKKSFNEYKETRIAFFYFLLVYVMILILILSNLTDSVWGRCLVILLSMSISTGSFLFSMLKPLYGCMFDKEGYLLKFREQMKELSSSNPSKPSKTPMSDIASSNPPMSNVDGTIEELRTN